jgi:MarR family transcriptional regulator, 2-MHQ and catechol-resistance regulon repressor
LGVGNGLGVRGKKTERALATYLNLTRAQSTLDSMLSLMLARRGLSMSQFRALEALLSLGPLPLATVGRKISSGASNMTMVSLNLEKRGLAVRRTDDEDTRKTRLHLTPEGRALVTKTFPKFAKIVRAQMDALDGRQQDTLRRLCRKLGHGDPQKFTAELVTFYVDDRTDV